MMAHQVPHQATDRRRVKVYELRNNDWFDRGTGFCTATFSQPGEHARKEPRVLVEAEDHPERLLLETRIQKEDGFQKQQETLIVWQEPGSGVDMALSFQEAEGCALIWRFINNVQQALQQSSAVNDDGLADEISMEMPTSVNLPAAELGNLLEIEASMRLMTSSANGRDALAKAIMAEDYIGKLIPLVEMAEDLESLSDLHRLCNIMKTVLLLNDTTIIEHAVSDECVLGVVGALEYDPDFPSHKANHRHWLAKQDRFKEVVHIDDELTRQKIHQTYRLQYLKDVVLARILDDPTFSVLNSLIFFNQVDIIQHLQTNSAFLGELFSIFSPRCTDQARKKEAVLFIQQCCAIAKNIQPPARQALYNNFIAHGLLQVIHFGLRHDDVGVRVGATDILISIIDHDPSLILQTAYRQMHENQVSLTDSLIELLLVEVDLGVKCQISDALKVLLDKALPSQGGPLSEPFPKINGDFSPRQRPQTTLELQHELFLTQFYERSAPKMFKPLLEIEHRTDMNFPVQQASVFSNLVEILCFFIRQHQRFSRYFVMSHNIFERICQLLKCPEKYLRLVAIRFFRNMVAFQDEFYIKHLTEKHIPSAVLDALMETLPRDNLLSSATLEFFDYIRKEQVKDIIKHLVAHHRHCLVNLSYMSTFRDILMHHDQTHGYTTNMEYFLDTEAQASRKPPPSARLMEQIAMDPTEEEYWNTSDPDEDEEDEEDDETDGKTASTNGSATSSKPLVDYASDDDESDENTPRPDNRGRGEDEEAGGDEDDGGDVEKMESTEASTGATESPEATSPNKEFSIVSTPPLERLSEKRRREEGEEDELEKLMQNKRRNNSSAESNSGASPRTTSWRRNFSSPGNATGKKMSISLSQALKTGVGGGRLEDET